MTDTSTVQLYLWPHRLLFIGPGLDTHAHRHHAAQLCISLGPAPVQVRGGDQEALLSGPAFFIPPDVSHQIVQHQDLLALFYFDPESQECEALTQHLGNGEADCITAVDPASLPIKAIHTLLQDQQNPTRANAVCNALPGLPGIRDDQIDARLQRVLDWLGDHLDSPVRLATLARIAHTSESWLAHAFTDTIGVPIRRYVLWRRLRLAIEAALGGASLTQAAHAAGFADAAHLSRTFRDNFGVAPSFLFSRRASLSVTFCSTSGPLPSSASPP